MLLQPSQIASTNASHGPVVDAVENKFRAHVFAMRIRLVDLFTDYDKLRSGYITATQFRRCIGAAYDKGVVSPLTEEECTILINQYDVKKNGMIKWRSFVDSIDKVFGAKKLEQTPTKYIPAPHEVVRNVGYMSPRSESVLGEVIERLRSYVKHHGSDVKSWFKDFDKYNNGYVTYNQFRRGIPQNLLSMEEEDILLVRYGETVTGTVNYFKMNTDVNRKAPRPKVDAAQLVAKLKLDTDYEHDQHVPVGTEELLHANLNSYGAGKPDLPFVEDKIKKYVYKNRIRLLEFFRDYDKHNFGLVSEAQFIASLRLSSLPLEDQEIAVLVKAYQKDGRVQYRQFCNLIDTVFTTINLEKDPLATVERPSPKWLLQGSNELSTVEEARFGEIIARFRALVKERRLLLAPFFKDFDKFLGNLGRVTRSHFSRLLSTMKMDISDADLHILFKKYEDRGQSKVNYQKFILDIDPETYHLYSDKDKSSLDSNVTTSKKNVESVNVASIKDIIYHIQTHVGTKRIRISEFFHDFDKLRSYSIPRQEFIRGVDMIECHLRPEEYEALADYYQDKNKKGCCRWRDFETEIEKVFVDTHLESRPSHIPNPIVVQNNPYLTKANLTPKEHDIKNLCLQNIREHLRIRQLTAKPFFKDFDKVCTGTGHVTRSQFRQCLTYMKVQVTDEEFNVLCKAWPKEDFKITDSKDYFQTVGECICYLKFLQELEESLETDKEPSHSIDISKNTSSSSSSSHSSVSSVKKPVKPLTKQEFDQLMIRIKSKVKRERIRVIDFMKDFDHMRHGKITLNEFRRGLKVVFSDLTEADLVSLELKYQSAIDVEMVDYVQFSDDIESVFTIKGLEKNPLGQIVEFIPGEVDPNLNILSPAEEKIFENIINRMVEKVRQRRIDPLTYLEDYDFINEGTITTNQFRSVLNDVGLAVDDEEIYVLAHRFATTKTMDRVNYRTFAAALAEYAGV